MNTDVALFLGCLAFMTGVGAVAFALITRGRRT